MILPVQSPNPYLVCFVVLIFSGHYEPWFASLGTMAGCNFFNNSSIDIKLYMVYSKPKTKSTKIKQQNNNNKFKIINRNL